MTHRSMGNARRSKFLSPHNPSRRRTSGCVLSRYLMTRRIEGGVNRSTRLYLRGARRIRAIRAKAGEQQLRCIYLPSPRRPTYFATILAPRIPHWLHRMWEATWPRVASGP
jgi:hypothetical protein